MIGAMFLTIDADRRGNYNFQHGRATLHPSGSVVPR